MGNNSYLKNLFEKKQNKQLNDLIESFINSNPKKDIYQRKHPQESKMCEDLYKYACLRIDKCPFMETKTFCSGCKVHCYQKEYRSQVKKVMRFSGKYMLFYHPLLTIKHGWLSLKERRRKNV